MIIPINNIRTPNPPPLKKEHVKVLIVTKIVTKKAKISLANKQSVKLKGLKLHASNATLNNYLFK